MPIVLAAPFPVTDPVLIFALAMVVFVTMPLLFERLRIPGVVGLILAGAAIGPNALFLLDRGATIVLLGTVGLLYLMFMIGLELDIHDFNRYRGRSVVFGTLSFALPQVVGTLVAVAFGYSIWGALLLGAVFASHTVLAYPIASRLGILKNLAVTTALGGTILTEILALLVLAIAAGGAAGAIDPTFWLTLLGSLALYIVAIMWGVPRITAWFFRRVRREPATDFAFVMALLFGVAYLAHAAHVEPIIGALLAGLAMNRLIPSTSALMSRIHFAGDAIFIPFFLLSVGMLVDVRALSTPAAWIFAGGLAFAVVASKWLAARVAEGIFRYSREEGWVVFGLTVPHASGTLAIVLVGFGQGLFDQSEVNAVVLTILVTCLLGPWVVERYGRRVAVKEEQRPYEPDGAPQRILIPISNPGTEEALLDLAMTIRDPDSDEPLYPLMVVPERLEGGEALVAEAERMLTHAVIYAAAANIPVLPLTRVDQNVAAGINRGVAETRSSTVVVGWDGGRTSAASEIFGGVLDQLLVQTRQTIVIARLQHPLNVTSRILLLIPPLANRHPGFLDAARMTSGLASRLGASVHGLVVGDEEARYEALFEGVKPAVTARFERVPGWSGLPARLRQRIAPGDLVVLLSARRGTLPWHPKLERLPAQLGALGETSFLVVYPPEVDTPDTDDRPGTPGPVGLVPHHVVTDLPAMPFERALRTILAEGFGDRSARLDQIVATLVASEREQSSEVRPGVVVPHARVSGIEEPILYLATSREGIELPDGGHPARLMFVLLSPLAHPQKHLRALAEIVRVVSRDGAVEEILTSRLGESGGDDV